MALALHQAQLQALRSVAREAARRLRTPPRAALQFIIRNSNCADNRMRNIYQKDIPFNKFDSESLLDRKQKE